MSEKDQLTDGMKKALLAVGYGVRKYRGGYYSIEDASERIDGRSLQALFDRKLISWDSSGGAPQIIELMPTEEGWIIFEEIRWE